MLSIVDDVNERECLDQRRLEEAHLKFCVLDVYQRYEMSFPIWTIAKDLQETLDEITPVFYEAFSSMFAGTYIFIGIANVVICLRMYMYTDHACTFPGCTSVLVIDGKLEI